MKDVKLLKDENILSNHSPSFDEEHEKVELPQVPDVEDRTMTTLPVPETCRIENIDDAMDSTVFHQEKDNPVELLPMEGMTTTQFSQERTMPLPEGNNNSTMDDSTTIPNDDISEPPLKRICISQDENYIIYET